MITFIDEIGNPLFSAEGLLPRVGDEIIDISENRRIVTEVKHKVSGGSPNIVTGDLVYRTLTRVYTERKKSK
jgi:hypothetical protein